MKIRSLTSVILFLISLHGVRGVAQEANYWNIQQGPEATLMGGAFTAGVRDNTAVVYNPGALGFIDNPSLSVSGDAAFFYVLNIKNGAGDGIDLSEFSGDAISMVFSGIITLGKNNKFKLNYGGFGKEYSHLRVLAEHEEFTLIPDSVPDGNIYFSDFDYRNRIKEDWYGLGWGTTITPNLSIGLSMMLANRSQFYGRNSKAGLGAVDSTQTSSTPIAYSSFSDDLQFSNFSFLWIVGVNYEVKSWKLGLNITTPRVNQTIVGRGTLVRSQIFASPKEDSLSKLYATTQRSVRTRYRSPWVIDLGVEYAFQKTTIAGRISYFTKVKPYNMLFSKQPESASEIITLPPDDPGFINMKSASKQLVNVAIGLRQKLSKTFTLLAGFRTDFNYFDGKTLDEQKAYYAIMSYWDMYHVSGGVIWSHKKLQVNIGVVYGFGYSRGDEQIINLTNPTLQNYMKGLLGNDTRASYHQVSGILGMTYLF
ncbi:hypothetical protein ACFLS7_04345 [Bacteroidota bacterium]